MATTNSAPHRHTHPSLTRTRRPKKLPAPSPSANANFLESILSSRAAAPSLFRYSKTSSLPCCTLAVCHCRSHASRIASPASSPPPSTQGAQGRSPPRCAISRPGRIIFTCDRFGSGKSRWVEPPALDLTKPVPCRRCAPSPRVTLATRLTGSFFHRA